VTKREHGTGGLVRFPGCRFWYAQYYIDGRKIRVSLRTESKQEARAALNRLIQSRDSGLLPDYTARKVTYADLRAILLANYEKKGRKSLITTSEGEDTISGLEALDAFIPAKTKAVSITAELADRFIIHRQKEGIGNAYINRSLGLLRRMFTLAHDRKKVMHVPKFDFLKEPPARRGFVTLTQFEKIVTTPAFPARLLPLVTVLFYTGVRLGEAKSIEWGQVDLEAGLIRLEGDQTKNAEPRYLPIGALAGYLAKVEPKVGKVFNATNLTKAWRQACVDAGFGKWRDDEDHSKGYDGIIIHDLRRSAIKRMVDSGIRESVAMRISGHKTTNVFRRYNIIEPKEVIAAMQNVPSGTNIEELIRSKTV
jgi:integrase